MDIHKSKLRQMRELQGWTQRDVADKLDLPDTRTLRRWESGEAAPSLRYRAKLCDIFEMSPEELGFSLEKTPSPIEIATHEQHMQQSEVSESPLPGTAPPSLLLPLHKISSSPNHWNRQRLLEKVYTFWIKEVLDQSLHESAHITLELQELPGGVVSPWSQIIELSPRPQLPDVPPLQVYDDACSELLILGEPGAGKTTLLLELARELLQRAVENEHHPVPVVFHLSSWSMKRSSLATWLVEELSSKYQIPQRIGQSWVENDQILPLLDGLDEVGPAFRNACVETINAYHQTHGLLPMVVCSRKEEYLSLATRLTLQKAICIQPLTAQQIEAYLTGEDECLEALRQALHEDVELQRLVTTPLMLNVLTAAYRSQPADLLKASGSLETRRKQVFAAYVESMLKRRKQGKSYPLQQSVHWLRFLAQQMKRRGQAEFYLERMQLDWLPGKRLQQLCYGLFIGLWAGVLSAILVALIAGSLGDQVIEALVITPCIALVAGMSAGIGRSLLEQVIARPVKKVLAGVLTISVFGGGIAWFGRSQIWRGFNSSQYEAIVGLVVVLVLFLPGITDKRILPAEVVNWSWTRVRKIAFSSSSIIIIFIYICIEVIGGIFGWLEPDMGFGIIVILLFASFSLFSVGLFSGFSSEMLDERRIIKPNQGIHRSAYHALRNGLLAGSLNMFALVIIGTFIERFFPTLVVTTNFLLCSELTFSLTLWLIVGIQKGGDACIKHFLLRLMLYMGRYIPWDYARFLDYAGEHLLLYKIGGGYMFIHRALLDYFASLPE